MIVVVDTRHGLAAVTPRPWQRLRARARSGALERRLAQGVAPESDPLLAYQALRLTRPRVRRRLIRTLDAVIRASTCPSRSWVTARVALPRTRIRQATPELTDLIDALRRPGPVSARGMAMIGLLLSEGSSPLHAATDGTELCAQLRRIVDALGHELWPASA